MLSGATYSYLNKLFSHYGHDCHPCNGNAIVDVSQGQDSISISVPLHGATAFLVVHQVYLDRRVLDRTDTKTRQAARRVVYRFWRDHAFDS